MGGTFADAVSGDNAVINVLVADQGGNGYVIEKLNLTPDQVADFKADPNLAGRALDVSKLKDLGLDVNEQQTYYSFDDISEAVMGRFNDAVRGAFNINHHLQAEYTGNDAQTYRPEPVEVYDTNGITAMAQSAERVLESTLSEVYGSDVENMEEYKMAPKAIEDLKGAEELARSANEIWFHYDKPPMPGAERIDPNYEQFLPDPADGAVDNVVPELK